MRCVIARIVPTGFGEGGVAFAASLCGPTQPVEGAALGDRSGGGGAQGLKMTGGDFGLVQLCQGDPAGEEFGVNHSVARGEAVAVHRIIGGAPVSLLQGVQIIVAALGPQGVVADRVARSGREVGQKREGFGLTVLRPQDTNPFQDHDGIDGLCRGQ